MVSLGNICDIAAGYGSICEYLIGCGTLREFLRKLGRVRKRPFGSPTSPTFVCARARSKPTSSKLEPLFATTREVHEVDFWPHTGPFASIPAPHEPKTCRFCLISSLSTRRGGVWGLCYGSMAGAGGRCDWLGVRWGYGGVALYPIRLWDRVYITYKTGFGNREKEHKGIYDQNSSKPSLL